MFSTADSHDLFTNISIVSKSSLPDLESYEKITIHWSVSFTTRKNRFTSGRLSLRVGGLIGVSNSENNGLMPAGLFIKHPYTVYLDTQQSFEITDVNGFVGIRDGYSFGGIVLFFCTFGQVQQIKTGSYSGISLTFKDSTTLILKNTSSNRRGYQIFYQQIFF